MSVGDLKIRIKTLLQFIVLILVMIGLWLFGADIWMVLAVGVLGVMLMHCLNNIALNSFFLFFLFSFSIFLMSGDVAELLFDRHYHLQFGQEATLHAHKCIFISLLSMLFGYVLITPKRKKADIISNQLDESSITTEKAIKNISKWVYVVAYVIILINTIDTIRFVASYGYIAYYTSFDPILPSILVQIGEFTPLALCVYLSTFPTKEESSLVIKSFLLYSLLTLFVGARGPLIINISFLICYCLYRNYTDKGKTVWLSKRTTTTLVLLVPFLLSFLFLYEYIRTGRDVQYTSFGDSIVDFFVNIGSASQNIKYGYEYRNEIPHMRFYSFGGTLNYFKYGTLFNLFDLDSIPSRHSIQFAMESHSFDAMLSYLTIPTQFLRGQGTGSSFIAELFADFGYIGVALGSAIYGCVFKKLSYIDNHHWLLSTIKFYIVFEMFFAPRASFDGFIAAILNVNNIFFVCMIYVLAKSLQRMKKTL
ncbi:MAG: O-antigen polysaccharide polymerase Wzy family protein [Clostridia bacterium]|nr:O-antigen polysaccharide polymerase Wzy family protein [Clostridia bacterium]